MKKLKQNIKDPIINKKIDKLLIINTFISKKYKGGSKSRVTYLCECGKKGTTGRWHLLTRKHASCGCTPKPRDRTLIEGKVYNQVLFIKYLDKRSGKNIDKIYKCFCGKRFRSYLNPTYNKRGKDRSLHCGCLKAENQSCSLKRPYKHIRIRYNSIKTRKIHRLNLSFDEYVELCKKDCAYCGYNPLHNKVKKTLKAGKYRPVVDVYNGVDRIDSSYGYVKGNVSPCCAVCNRMKMDLNIDTFYLHIRKILKYYNKNKRKL